MSQVSNEEEVNSVSTTSEKIEEEEEQEDPPRQRLERAYQKFTNSEQVEVLDLGIPSKTRNKQNYKFTDSDLSKVRCNDFSSFVTM